MLREREDGTEEGDSLGCRPFPAGYNGFATRFRLYGRGRFPDNNGLYDRLAGALKRAGVLADRVFITEYFDSTQGAPGGGTCDPLIQVDPNVLTVGGVFVHVGEGVFDRAEAQWASDSVLAPLNNAVHNAAEKHGWRVIFGSQQEYRDHGYCSADSWIVGLTESLWNQANKEGTLHSTTRGNTFQAQLVIREIRNFFYKGGIIRVPAN